MKPWSACIIAGLASTVIACGPPAPSPANDGQSARPISSPLERLEAGPQDFLLFPCFGTSGSSPCAIIIAGGKALLFGAPEGIVPALEALEESQPDGVFLVTLESDGMAGLIGLRTHTWIKGRTTPLSVAGPEGTALTLAYLDKALERSDALTYIRHRPPGRFDAALFAPFDILPGEVPTVFDSGDLRVTAVTGKGGVAHYAITYSQITLVLTACPPPTPSILPGADMTMACEETDRGDRQWPIPPQGVSLTGAIATASKP